MVAQRHQAGDACVQLLVPALRQPCPILNRQGAVVRQHRQRRLDFRKRNSGPLRHLDHRHAPQNAAGITTLVAAAAVAADQPLGLIEMQGGNGDAAALRDFADCQLASHFAVSHNRHDAS
ncbi:hypothetical protein D3C87_1732390 [compost metagenome]